MQDTQIQNKTKTNIFSLAVNCEVEGLRDVLEGGADVNERDINQQTALHNMLSVFPCNVLSSLRYDKCVQLFVEAKINLELKDNNGDTVLHVAIVYGKLYAACLFIMAGANIYAQNVKRETCYDLARKRGCLFVLEALLVFS